MHLLTLSTTLCLPCTTATIEISLRPDHYDLFQSLMTTEKAFPVGKQQLGAPPPASYGNSLLYPKHPHVSGVSHYVSQHLLQRCPTVVHKQVRPQAALLQNAAGCWCWGSDFIHGDVKAHALELLHKLLPGRLGFVSAEPQLQPRCFDPVE